MPHLDPELAAQLGTAILVAISQQIISKQCRHIAYLMNIGYRRKESLCQIERLLQQLNQEASDLVTQAATNTANMTMENMSLTDDGTDGGSDSSITDSEDDHPLQHKRKKGPHSSQSAGKRPRIASVSSVGDASTNNLSPSPSVVRRQPGVTVEVPLLKTKMAIYDLSVSPLRRRSESIARRTDRESVELGLEYTLPESGQRQVVPLEDQLYIPSSPTSDTGGFALQSPMSEPEPVSNNALKGGVLDNRCDNLRAPQTQASMSQNTRRSSDSAPPHIAQAKHGCESRFDGDRTCLNWHHAESAVQPSIAELATNGHVKWTGRSAEDPVYIKSESECEDLNFAVKNANAKARKLAKREKRKELKALTDKPEPAHSADIAGSVSSPCFPSQSFLQISGSLLSSSTKEVFPPPNPTTPPPKRPKIKREKSSSVSPRKASSRQDRGEVYHANKDFKRRKTLAEQKRQLPTPPGSTPSNATLPTHSRQNKSSHPRTTSPKRWHHQVQAAFTRDKEVRASAPGPSSMMSQIGVTEYCIGCGDDVIHLTHDNEPLSPGERSSLPGPKLTFKCGRERSHHQQLQHAKTARGNPEAERHQLKEQHKLQMCHSPQELRLPHRTGPIRNINASRPETVLQSYPPESLLLPHHLLLEESRCPPELPRPKNVLDPVLDSCKPLVPNFNQRTIAMRERYALPNPGRRHWLPLPSVRQRTPAEWYRLGQTPATNARMEAPGINLDANEAVLEMLPRNLNPPMLRNSGYSLSETDIKRRSQRPIGSTQPQATTRLGWRDPSWSANSRSPSGESSYLLWGSIRMKTTWDEDENTVVDAYSEFEVSDGLEIVNVPRPRRWGLSTVGQMDVTHAGRGK